MKGYDGIYYIANFSSYGYYKVLQSGLKEKHLFSFEYGVFRPIKEILMDRDNT